jgi:hypothetical protein
MPPLDSRATDEFLVRYYRWALDDARREVQEGFPLLRGVKSTLVIRALGFLESFAEIDRPRVATALVKRFHRRAVGITADSWGPEEERVNRDYQDAMRILRPEEEWYRQALLHDPAALRLDRARFLAAVKVALAPILGAGEPFSSKHDWRYATPLGPWTLVTLLDVGGRAHQLMYTQTIRAVDPRPLHEGLSLCGWLGLGGQTAWNQLTEADAPAAAPSLARICAHFLQAAPALVAGLSPA